MEGNKSLFRQVLEKKRVIGVVGNKNEGKTSLVLNELLKLSQEDKKIYVFGVREKLNNFLEDNNINVLLSGVEVFNLKDLKNSIIYIDEINNLIPSYNKNKNQDRFKRFINLIYHSNNILIYSTAEQGYFNKFICGLTEVFILKETNINILVNGTNLKEYVLSLPNIYPNRIGLKTNEYYIFIDGEKGQKGTFEYNPLTDTKKGQTNPAI